MILTSVIAGGCGLAMLLGIGKVVMDLKASRRDTPLKPWEKNVPDA